MANIKLIIRFVPLLTMAIALSGCKNAAIKSEGRVLIEGEPATNGKLMLNPVGEGAKAFSMVDDTGAFKLRTIGGGEGVLPGEYTVFFQRTLSEEQQKPSDSRAATMARLDEVTLNYRAPKDKTVNIQPDQKDELIIDIREQDGWKISVSD